jgi:hypothetical protein
MPPGENYVGKSCRPKKEMVPIRLQYYFFSNFFMDLKKKNQTNEFQNVSPEETIITLGSGDFCSSLTSPKHY